MNKHTIKLVEDKQPHHSLIGCLKLIELEILKFYIDTHLKTGFI